MGLTVLLGGARSGKSALAVRRALGHPGPVCVIATAAAGDPEMTRRIEHHRQERPQDWRTIEETLDLEGALSRVEEDALVIVDCLTLWVSNQLAAGASDEAIEAHAGRAAQLAAAHAAPVIAVSNELGMGIVPFDELVRRFRDLHGRVNTTWVAHAAHASLLVAGALLELTPVDPPRSGAPG